MKAGKIILWILVAGVIVGGGYYGYKMITKIKTKEDAIDLIMKYQPSRDKAKLQSWGEGFLIALANSIKSNKVSFKYDGKTYSTDTATVIG